MNDTTARRLVLYFSPADPSSLHMKDQKFQPCVQTSHCFVATSSFCTDDSVLGRVPTFSIVFLLFFFLSNLTPSLFLNTGCLPVTVKAFECWDGIFNPSAFSHVLCIGASLPFYVGRGPFLSASPILYSLLAVLSPSVLTKSLSWKWLSLSALWCLNVSSEW